MRPIILLIFLFCLISSPCLAAKGAKKSIREGNKLYTKGEFEQARESYTEALLLDPDSDIVNFNLGGALYKTEDYRGAINHFEQSLVSDEDALQQKASYNTANAKYKYGITKENTELEEAVALLKESLRHYERAIVLDSEDKDAKYNYEFVKKELERLEKKLEQQQQQKKQQQKRKSAKEQKERKPQESKEDEKSKEQEQPQQSQQPQEPEEEQTSQAQPKESSKRMSEEEARMLLESYNQDEEPRGLYKEKLPAFGLSEVAKDW